MSGCMKKYYWICVVLVLFAVQVHAADSVLRKGSGRSLKGDVISQNPNKVVVKNIYDIIEEVPVN
ncbi:MAG: hypothetical protein OSA43_08970, partial [Pirellulales bacterium]|nr:hypothetical protein [Pirellulales bacterium]